MCRLPTRCGVPIPVSDLVSSDRDALALIEEGVRMSQFIMVRTSSKVPVPEGSYFQKIDKSDSLFGTVSAAYGFAPDACRLVVDNHGCAEPLIDDLHDALRRGQPIIDTSFGRFAYELFRSGVEFICWCATDFRELLVVHSWEEFLEQIKIQAALQPADVFLYFGPYQESSTSLQ